MRFVGALAELEDEFGQVEGEEWVQEAGAEGHIFLFHLSLKDYLVIKKVLKPHVVVFRVKLGNFEGKLVSHVERHRWCQFPPPSFQRVQRILLAAEPRGAVAGEVLTPVLRWLLPFSPLFIRFLVILHYKLLNRS